MKYLKSQGADGNPLAWIYHEDNTYGLYYFVLTDLGSLFCSGPFTIPLVTYMLVQIDIEWWEHETIICQIDVMTNVTLQKQQNRTTTPLTDRPRSAKKRSQSVSQSVSPSQPTSKKIENHHIIAATQQPGTSQQQRRYVVIWGNITIHICFHLLGQAVGISMKSWIKPASNPVSQIPTQLFATHNATGQRAASKRTPRNSSNQTDQPINQSSTHPSTHLRLSTAPWFSSSTRARLPACLHACVTV